MTSPIDSIANHIFMLRGRRVMLDRHLAELYGVRSLRLREQVKRNIERFPNDFMFRLSIAEAQCLVSQNAIPSWKHLGGSLPYVFTQEGVAMLSSVLRGERAVQVNIQIMRAFVRFQGLLSGHRALRAKIDALEKRYDAQFRVVFDAIRSLMPAPPAGAKKVGFRLRD
jgi:hypothetical protein